MAQKQKAAPEAKKSGKTLMEKRTAKKAKQAAQQTARNIRDK